MTEPPEQPPVFVIGCGRSGTTLFFRMLAEHPALAWISNYSNRFPRSRWARRVARLRHAPGVRALGEHPWRPRPVEGYAPWVECFPGFNRPLRDLRAEDADERCASRMRALVREHQQAQGRPRFCAKYTGWPRIGFMDRAFPEARYLHVVRDGRAVAASLLRVGFWEGWKGPEQWRWGPLSAEDAACWEASDRSFAVLAGLQWKLLTRSIRAAGERAGTRYREVRYEELVADPAGVMAAAVGHAGLPDDPRHRERLDAFAIRDADAAWPRAFSPEERGRLERAIAPELQALGYAP